MLQRIIIVENIGVKQLSNNAFTLYILKFKLLFYLILCTPYNDVNKPIIAINHKLFTKYWTQA